MHKRRNSLCTWAGTCLLLSGFGGWLAPAVEGAVTASPSGYDFGSVAVAAQAAATLTYTFTNLSSTPSFQLSYGLEFGRTMTSCTPSSCSLQVTFSPQFPGLRTDAITVVDGTSGTVLAVTYLHGIGLAPLPMIGPAAMTTYAGTGAWGYSGNNNYATQATFRNPMGLVADPAGNLYVADSFNSVIRKIAAGSGIITTYAGNGTLGYSGDGGAATRAQLNSPAGLALDGAGNLYVADQGNNVIRMVTAAGQISTVAGGGMRSSGTDGMGDGGPATSAVLYGPNDVAVDSTGNLFIADSFHHLVREVLASSHQILVVAGGGKGGGTNGYGDGGAPTNAILNNPTGLALDSNGKLYIADAGHSLVRIVDLTANTIKTVAGSGISGYTGDGGPALSATLSNPYGLAVDAAGNVYIADAGNNAVRQVQAGSGFISTVVVGAAASGGPALSNPTNVTLLPAGSLYVADNANNMIRQVSGAAPKLNLGSTTVGQLGAAQTVIVSNNGNQPLHIETLAIPSGFQQQASGRFDCAAGAVLAAGGSCGIGIALAPTVAGSLSGTVQVVNTQSTPHQVTVATLTGTAVAGSAPKLSVSPSSLVFAGQIAGTTSAPQTITLSNTGTAALAASYISLQGVNAQDFVIGQTTCGASLAPNQSCSLSVTFAPVAAGIRSASIVVTNSASGTQSIALSGTGLGAASAVTFAGTSLSFGTQPRNTVSLPLPVKLQNSGTATLSLSGIGFSGTSASDFQQTNNCNTSLPAGQGCIIWVTYQPGQASAATAQASIVIADSAPGSPHTYALNGTAISWGQSRITMDAPASNGTPVSGNISISGWAINDNAAITSVDVSIDGQLIGTAQYGQGRSDVCAVYPGRPNCPNVGWSLPFNTTTLGDGVHRFQIRAWSANVATSTSYQVTTANLAPFSSRVTKINIDQPGSQAKVQGTIQVSGWAIDDRAAVSSVSLLVDGVKLGNAQYGNNRGDVCGVYPGRSGCPNVGWSTSIDTTKLADGSHSLVILATTTDGRSSTSSVGFSVANAASSTMKAAIDSPAANSTVSGTISIGGWAFNPTSAVKSFSVAVDGQAISTVAYGNSRGDVCAVFSNPAGCPNVGWGGSLNTTNFADGGHVLQITATSADGHSLTVANPFTIANLHDPSTDLTRAWIDAPSSGAKVSGSMTAAGWAVAQISAVVAVEVSVDGVPYTTTIPAGSRPDICGAFPGTFNCATAGWQAQVDTTVLADGTHTLSITAISQTGHRTTTSTSFVSSNAALWTSKSESVTIDAPAGSASTGIIAVTGTAVDNISGFGSVLIALDGVPVGNAQYGLTRNGSCASCSWTFNFDTRLIADGVHTLAAIATGSNGTAAGSRSITINNGSAANSVIASIDQPVSGVKYNGYLQLGGWALDRTDLLSTLTLTLDGVPFGPLSYGGGRSDVCAVFPNSPGCPNVGWGFGLDTTMLSNGTHSIGITLRSAQGHALTSNKTFTVSN